MCPVCMRRCTAGGMRMRVHPEREIASTTDRVTASTVEETGISATMDGISVDMTVAMMVGSMGVAEGRPACGDAAKGL